jgi:hypothetical protein
VVIYKFRLRKLGRTCFKSIYEYKEDSKLERAKESYQKDMWAKANDILKQFEIEDTECEEIKNSSPFKDLPSRSIVDNESCLEESKITSS